MDRVAWTGVAGVTLGMATGLFVAGLLVVAGMAGAGRTMGLFVAAGVVGALGWWFHRVSLRAAGRAMWTVRPCPRREATPPPASAGGGSRASS
jgi:hypothetical protein